MPPPGPVGGPTSFGLVGPVAASLHHIDQTGKVRELSFCMQQQEKQNSFCYILWSMWMDAMDAKCILYISPISMATLRGSYGN